MKTFSKIFGTTATIVTSAVVALPAYAQTGGGLVNPLKVSSVQELLGLVMNTVVTLGSILLTLMIIYVGFLFVLARGNEEKISQARTALLWTVIGGLILLGASAIANVIAATATSILK